MIDPIFSQVTLGAIPHIELPATDQIIKAQYFNVIQNQIFRVIGPDFYRYKGQRSVQVSVGANMSTDVWFDLFSDINKMAIHQSNQGLGITPPANTSIITATFVNSLIDGANQIFNNRSTFSENQLVANNLNSSSKRTEKWNSNLLHSVSFTWQDQNDALAFFRLGGYFIPSIASSNNSDNIDDNRYRDLVATAQANLQDERTRPKFKFDLEKWFSLSPGIDYSITLASIDRDNIRLVYKKVSDSQLLVSMQFNTDPRFYQDGTDFLNADIESTIFYYTSFGDSNYDTGIPSPYMDVKTESFLTANGIDTHVEKKFISLVPSTLSFVGYTTATSEQQVLTIKNIGNTQVLISGISGTSNGGTLQSSPNDFPKALAVGESTNYSLSYIDNGVAMDFLNRIYINGDFTIDYAIDATLTVKPRPFNFKLSESVFTATVTTSTSASIFTLDIIPDEYTTYSEYSVAIISGIPTRLYGITYSTKSKTSIDFYFDGYNYRLPRGLYGMKIEVTIQSIKRYFEFYVNNQISQSTNMTTWVSPSGKYNSIIGVSYDLIDGYRYLTVGIGTTANGASALSASSYPLIEQLGYLGDTKFLTSKESKYQSPMYKTGGTGSYSNYSSFLNTYGVWVDDGSVLPIGSYIYKTFSFDIPADTTITYQFSVDDNGYFMLDGAQVFSAVSNLGSSKTGTYFLTKGTHTVTLVFKNNWNGYANDTRNPGAVGLKISDSSRTYWSTLDTLKTGTGYRGWQEVYRIPLSSAGTYYSKEYCVKDVRAVNGSSWGDFYTNGSMFYVKYDGKYDIRFYTNSRTNPTLTTGMGTWAPTLSNYQTTFASLDYAFYYRIDSANRYTNLIIPSIDTYGNPISIPSGSGLTLIFRGIDESQIIYGKRGIGYDGILVDYIRPSGYI